jgi:hypothetical protein
LYEFYVNKPYPTRADFIDLERSTGLTQKKLLYWFSNRRRRDDIAVRRKPSPEKCGNKNGHSNKPEELLSKEEKEKADLRKKLEEIRARKRVQETTEEEDDHEEDMTTQEADETEGNESESARPTALFKPKSEEDKFLMEFYKKDPYPRKADFPEMQERTGWDSRKIHNWFSNRRRRDGIVKSRSPRENGDKEDSGKIQKEIVDGILADANDFSCRVCNFITKCRPNLLRHLRKYHKLPPKHCKKCRLVFLKPEYRSHSCFSEASGQKRRHRSRSKKPPDKEASPSRSKSPKCYSSRYKSLLKSLGGKNHGSSKKDKRKRKKTKEGLDLQESLLSSPFHRNGKFEVVMVTGEQFDAVQSFLAGGRMVQVHDLLRNYKDIECTFSFQS